MTHLTPNLTPHLTEDQLDDLLIGEGSAVAKEHLAACAQCRAALAPFETSVASFNHAAMAWSEAKSNTLNRDLASVRLHPRLTPTTAWSFAAAALIVIALIVSTVLHHQQEPLEASVANHPQLRAASNSTVSDVDRNRDREIAADNALLGAIDSELRPQAPPSGLFDPVPSNHPRHNNQVQD